MPSSMVRTTSLLIVLALVLFFVAIFAGVPVGFVLMLASAAYLWASDASFVVLPQTMVNGTGNFILLAIPFFILAGLIMERGGISLRMVRFIQTLVGHLRGGLLQVTVVSMYIVYGYQPHVGAPADALLDFTAQEESQCILYANYGNLVTLHPPR